MVKLCQGKVKMQSGESFMWICFLFYFEFFSETLTIYYRTAGKKEGYFLNSLVIIKKSSALHAASNQTQTRAFGF